MKTEVAAKALYKDKRMRAWELDFMRGIAVLAMCFDHLMYDFAFIGGWFSNYRDVNNSFINGMHKFALEYWVSSSYHAPGFRFWAHYIFVFVFLFLVGTSCAFSRDNTKRGSQLAIVSLAFTGVTFALREIGIMTFGVVFGILHCISLSILVASAVDIASRRIKALNVYLPLVLGVTVCALGIYFEFWTMSTNYDMVFDSSHLTGYILGGYAYGDDWFPLLPYVGPVLIGMYWGKAAYPTRRSLLPVLDGKWHKPFTFVGKHALIFYLAHQVVLAGLVILLCLCLGYKLAL